MADAFVNEAWLDGLRMIGDPDMAGLLKLDQAKKLLEAVRSDRLLSERIVLPDHVFKAVPDLNELEFEFQADRVIRAQRLFATYGTEIAGALLLAALPQSYAAQWGSRVLAATTRLQDDFRRRIVGTAQFLVIVMRGAKDIDEVRRFWTKPHDDLKAAKAERPSTPWRACLAVRAYHEAIRQVLADPGSSDEGMSRLADLLGDHNTPPLNQEDMLATLLSFTVTVFEVLERYGIAWTEEEQEAYLHAWDVIGAHLGIGYYTAVQDLPSARGEGGEGRDLTWRRLRPKSIDDTRTLLDQMRARQWVPLPPISSPLGDDEGKWEGARAGRRLVRALLDELSVAMPLGMQGLPISVMRALAPDVVRDRLGLGGGGLITSTLGLLPQRHALVERFTALPVVNPFGGRVLRLMANQVTTHAIVRFIRRGRLEFPDLKHWSEGLSDPIHMALDH